jgi:hypothetical protein
MATTEVVWALTTVEFDPMCEALIYTEKGEPIHGKYWCCDMAPAKP